MNTKICGVYLSCEGVEIVSFLRKNYAEWRIDSHYCHKLPPSVISYTGEIIDTKFLSATFLYLKKHKFLSDKITVCIGGSEIFSGIFQPDPDADYSIIDSVSKILPENKKFKIEYKEIPNGSVVYFGCIPAECLSVIKQIANYTGIKIISLEPAQISAQRGFAFIKSTAYKPLTNILFIANRLILTNWDDSGIKEYIEIDMDSDKNKFYNFKFHNNLIWYGSKNSNLRSVINYEFMKNACKIPETIIKYNQWNNSISRTESDVTISPMVLGCALWPYTHVTIPRFNFSG